MASAGVLVESNTHKSRDAKLADILPEQDLTLLGFVHKDDSVTFRLQFTHYNNGILQPTIGDLDDLRLEFVLETGTGRNARSAQRRNKNSA